MRARINLYIRCWVGLSSSANPNHSLGGGTILLPPWGEVGREEPSYCPLLRQNTCISIQQKAEPPGYTTLYVRRCLALRTRIGKLHPIKKKLWSQSTFILTCPLLVHALYVEVGSAVGVGADEDTSLRKMQTQQFDALLEGTSLATPKRTKNQRWDLHGYNRNQ